MPTRRLQDINDQPVDVPAATGRTHLQFRRFAACPICHLHLRSFANRHQEVADSGITEVVFFHSAADALRGYQSLCDTALMTMARVRRGTELLLSPQSPPATGGLIVLTGLRLLAGLIWLYNVVWKVPPDFGERGRRDLYHFTHLAVEHPVFTPFSWVIEHAVLPYFTAFGWGVLFAESALAVLLLTGTAVRLAALIGIGQSVAIGLSVAESPGEWPWAYAMLLGIHVVLLFTCSTRYAAVDAVRAAATGSAARTAAQRLLAGWGIVLGLIGLVAVWRGLGDDRPAYVGIRALEFSLGEYNLRGALALIAIALAMLAAAKRGWRTVALVAAVVAVAAAAAIYLQVGRTAVWLGGTNTTAAVFVCAAVVSLATEFRIGRVEGA